MLQSETNTEGAAALVRFVLKTATIPTAAFARLKAVRAAKDRLRSVLHAPKRNAVDSAQLLS